MDSILTTMHFQKLHLNLKTIQINWIHSMELKLSLITNNLLTKLLQMVKPVSWIDHWITTQKLQMLSIWNTTCQSCKMKQKDTSIGLIFQTRVFSKILLTNWTLHTDNLSNRLLTVQRKTITFSSDTKFLWSIEINYFGNLIFDTLPNLLNLKNIFLSFILKE